MLTQKTLVTEGWNDYELIDSGGGKKLERFASVVLDRPETQALWHPLRPETWKSAHARFVHTDGKGMWSGRAEVPQDWDVSWHDMVLGLSQTNFKHIGVFPEQAANWGWIQERVRVIATGGVPKVLNLFGYTGAASIVAALAGAHVTHVDASKQSLDWAHENARLSGVSEDSIRYIPDDVLKFAAREVRRGNRYDGIILDPPAFGRGYKGEVWKIEEDLPKLTTILKELLTEKAGTFFLMNGYAAGYSPIVYKQLIEGVFGDVNGEYGELIIRESHTDRAIPTGIYTRFIV